MSEYYTFAIQFIPAALILSSGVSRCGDGRPVTVHAAASRDALPRAVRFTDDFRAPSKPGARSARTVHFSCRSGARKRLVEAGVDRSSRDLSRCRVPRLRLIEGPPMITPPSHVITSTRTSVMASGLRRVSSFIVIMRLSLRTGLVAREWHRQPGSYCARDLIVRSSCLIRLFSGTDLQIPMTINPVRVHSALLSGSKPRPTIRIRPLCARSPHP